MKLHSHKNKASVLPFLRYFNLFLILLVVLFISLSFTTAIADEQEEMKKSIQIINPRPNFSLSLRLDKGLGATYTPGERIRIYFRTTRNAYVTLFGYDAQGNVRLLFPNQYKTNQFVQANREYSIDGIIEAGTPAGTEFIQGFATTEPVIISRELERRIKEEIFPKLEDGVNRFTQRIKGILKELPSQRWVSSEILYYQVIERGSDIGRLRLNSSPEGADVYLNNRYAGKTPLVLDRLHVGDYSIRIELSGYQTWSRTIRIDSDRTSFIRANLQRLQQYASLTIRCNEDNARIYVDGQYKGLTERNRSVLLEQISEGYHDIRITLDGFRDWNRRINIDLAERVQLNVNLEKISRTGILEITCDVDNAMIYLDGNYERRTSSNRNVRIENIQEGIHELRIIKEGYRDYLATLRIYPDSVYQVDVKMRQYEQKGAIAVHCNENNAKIFINGIYKAVTKKNQSKILDDLKEGMYEITIVKDGYRTWLGEAWVYPGETTSVFADLVKVEN